MSKFDRAGAHRRAQQVRDGVTAITDLIDTLVEIQERQDWLALGYKSWTEYYEGEFGPARLKLSAEQRAQVVGVLAASGMSKRQVAKALGVSDMTVRRDLAGATNVAPDAAKRQVKAKDDVTLALTGVIEDVAAHTSGAVPPASTEDTSPVLGEPDVDEQAASTSGTPDPLSPIGRAIATAPAGSAHGAPDFRDHDTDSPAADPLSDSSSHAGVPAVGGQIHEQENGWSGPNGDCGVSCTCGVMFDGFDTIGEARALLDLHIANPEERDEEEAAEPPVDTPAAGVTSLPDGEGDPTPEPEQQPGHNSPTGLEAAQPREGRSETDHQQDAGVSSPAGEAPEVASTDPVEPVELEGGGAAQDPPSSSDPGERLLLVFAEFVYYLDGVDFDAVGPMLRGADLEALHSHVESITAYVGKLGRARFAEMLHTP